MYTLETLKKGNESYDYQHGVNDADVININKLKTLLEDSLKTDLRAGVIVVCKGEEKTYENGHLDAVNYLNEYGYHVCVQPSIYVGFSDRGFGYWFSTSGGYFFHEKDSGKFIPTGETRLKRFWTFGHCGACGGGGIYFQAEVAVYKYESDRIY